MERQKKQIKRVFDAAYELAPECLHSTDVPDPGVITMESRDQSGEVIVPRTEFPFPEIETWTDVEIRDKLISASEGRLMRTHAC
jgi:hypothetical protein